MDKDDLWPDNASTPKILRKNILKKASLVGFLLEKSQPLSISWLCERAIHFGTLDIKNNQSEIPQLIVITTGKLRDLRSFSLFLSFACKVFRLKQLCS